MPNSFTTKLVPFVGNDDFVTRPFKTDSGVEVTIHAHFHRVTLSHQLSVVVTHPKEPLHLDVGGYLALAQCIGSVANLLACVDEDPEIMLLMSDHPAAESEGVSKVALDKILTKLKASMGDEK